MNNEFLHTVTLRGFLNKLSGSDYPVQIFRGKKCLLWGQTIPEDWLDSYLIKFEVSYDYFKVFVFDMTVDEWCSEDTSDLPWCDEDEYEEEDEDE